MMQRKVIQLAGKTFVVSLPSTWAKQYKIKKGQELTVEPHGRMLQVSTTAQVGEFSKELDITGFSRALVRRCLGALYKAGYDRFEVRFSDPREFADAQEVIYEEFLGFEIVDQEKNSFSARQLSHVQPEEFPTVLRRIFRIIESMADESLEATQKKDQAWLLSIHLRDKSINKLADFCRRILNKQGLVEQRKVAPLYFIVETLEKVGDCFRDYSKYTSEHLFYDKALLSFHKKVNEYFRLFYELFYDFSLAKVDLLITKKQELEKEYDALLKKIQHHKAGIFLYTAYQLVYDMNGALMAYQL